ncbi:glycerophosphodiester phosphodiesterase [Proteobacteria bacterium 005FR1]|nr:glycerophosphodiester phosphodiesterase [Proteobacteria bacterium 005FR1]
MQRPIVSAVLTLACVLAMSSQASAEKPVELGPRPQRLAEDMEASALRSRLQACEGPFTATDFSIGHRGAPLMFPEHTRESYEAAARQGAGIVECDVTFTSDKELVCRHSQCDLHTTTDILDTELAARCRTPFQPAIFDRDGNLVQAASAECCTSDITLAEFRTLRGKQDRHNPKAQTATEFVDIKAGDSLGTLLTHRESIELFRDLNVKMAPELKAPSVSMPFKGMSQVEYAQKFIDEYEAEQVPASQVWPQSFSLADVRYWIENEPAFGRQAVYLDDRDGNPDFNHRDPATWEPGMTELADMGVNIIAPPLWMLLEAQGNELAAQGNEIVPSVYAREARAAGLKIIAWSLERSGPLKNGGGWYYQTLNGELPNPETKEPAVDVIRREGDVYRVLDVLARDVGVLGVFSDWPATVTFYANCMDSDR